MPAVLALGMLSHSPKMWGSAAIFTGGITPDTTLPMQDGKVVLVHPVALAHRSFWVEAWAARGDGLELPATKR